MSEHEGRPLPLVLPTPPAGGFSAISKYNPHLWSAEQLRAIFVARKSELADLLDSLRKTQKGTVGQHALLVGARGMGKSTLMQRLALAVEDDPELAPQWLALRFPEEQYTVRTLGQFWANVLDALADAIERKHEPTSGLDAASERIAALPQAEQPQAYLDAIAECASVRGQRFLLLVDNTDLLLNTIGKEAHWALRQVLQSQSHLLWVGGSYESLEANSEYHDAFLDFFRVIELRPLQLAEMQAALLALAQTFGGAAMHQQMQEQLTQQPERLATLRQLSGGNPRTTVMLYSLLASGQGGHVRTDLESLLDDMTPLYKSRFEHLADVPRKLLAHILEHWAPISMGELASASQEKAGTISPQLKRLELEGLIQRTTLQGTTRSGYQAAERFFNIWYLMRLSPRRQRTKLIWLVEFMRLWFSTTELQHLARGRIGSASGSSSTSLYELEYDRSLAEALPDNCDERHALRWSILKQLSQHKEKVQEQLSGFFDFEHDDEAFKGVPDYLRRLNALPALLQHCRHPATPQEMQEWVDAVLGSLSLSLSQKERCAREAPRLSRFQYDSMADVFRDEVKEFKERLGENDFAAIRHRVLNQDFFPDLPNSQLAYEQMRHCFSTHRGAAISVSETVLKNHQDDWALKCLEWVEQQFAVDQSNPKGWLLHYHLNRHKEAEAPYRKAIELNGNSAIPWNNLGNLLQDHLSRYDEAEAAYRAAIELDGKYAHPWNGLGSLLQDHLRRYDEAEAAYRTAIALDGKFAFAWDGLGNLLHQHLSRYDEAEAAYRTAIDLDGNQATLIANLARLLVLQKRRDEALLLFRQASMQLQADESHLSLQVHLFLGNQQLALDALEQLVSEAQNSNALAFYRLKEQVWECHELGLAETLADWMQLSRHAQFLQPFVQALYSLAGADTKLQDLPQETQLLADEIVRSSHARG